MYSRIINLRTMRFWPPKKEAIPMKTQVSVRFVQLACGIRPVLTSQCSPEITSAVTGISLRYTSNDDVPR